MFLVWIALPGLALAVSGNYAAIVYSLLGGCVFVLAFGGDFTRNKIMDISDRGCRIVCYRRNCAIACLCQ